MYNLTQKQEEAKNKLEDILWRVNRFWFKTQDEFDSYMKILIKQVWKKINLSKKVQNWETSWKEINDKKNEKILKYYNTEKWLRNYALKYIERYNPSFNKLFKKLIEKSKNEELTYSIITKLQEQWIQKADSVLCDAYIKQYMNMWKNFNKIKEWLFRKEFEKDLIDGLINEYKNNLEYSLLEPFALERKILWLLKKWKSEYFIKQKLSENEFDSELIESILKELNFDNTDIMKKELLKLQNKWLEKQKIVQRMFSKWYSFNDFKEFI